MRTLEEYDVIIVGAGPAGLTAAIYCARYGLNTAFFESPVPSQLAVLPFIENYPGFVGKGSELLEIMKEQAKKAGAKHVFKTVEKIGKVNEKFQVIADSEKYLAKTVIVATGGTHKELGIPGEREFLGKGVSYCATCDGIFFKGKKVVVIGGGNSAATDALYLHEIGCDVTIVHRRDELRAEKALQDEVFKRGISILWNCLPTRIEGDKKVRKIILFNKKTNKEFEVETEAVFIAIGLRPRTEIVAGLVELDSAGYIKVDRTQSTTCHGIFAAGDCCSNPLKQVVTACGEGAIAANSAFEYIKKLETKT